jgi:energy-coupling factor transport system ATP-binding protein
MRQQLISLLAELKKDWTLLIVSHEPGEMMAIADQCWTLEHGELAVADPASYLAPGALC